MRRWLMRLLAHLRSHPTAPHAPEAYCMLTLPPLPPVQRLHCETGVWMRAYPKLKAHPVEFFSEAEWQAVQAENEALALSLQDTQRVTAEQTDRYQALPWWMK